MFDLEFYRGKRVLVTGHTGFKGTWLCRILLNAGAVVTGYALQPPTNPSLFGLVGMENKMTSFLGDVRDLRHLSEVFSVAEPEIVFHLAAQPIVRVSYKDPVNTYGINVMGTVNVCDCVRKSSTVRSFLNVTTDKVYQNKEWEWGYRETDPLDGWDPYSNSKSCSELVTHGYMKSFFDDMGIAVSTARAGNVIGGGDFANDRIIPDCVRAAEKNEAIIVRNHYSIRPYQHVLEPLAVYLTIVQKQYEDKAFSGFYNVGPDDCDCISTGELADLFCAEWGRNLRWINQYDGGPHEAGFLKLDCSRLKKKFGWKPRWGVAEAVKRTVEWYQVYEKGSGVEKCMDEQISDFLQTEVCKDEKNSSYGR